MTMGKGDRGRSPFRRGRQERPPQEKRLVKAKQLRQGHVIKLVGQRGRFSGRFAVVGPHPSGRGVKVQALGSLSRGIYQRNPTGILPWSYGGAIEVVGQDPRYSGSRPDEGAPPDRDGRLEDDGRQEGAPERQQQPPRLRRPRVLGEVPKSPLDARLTVEPAWIEPDF